MKFKIATPERVMLDAEVDSVTLPTTLGEITVLPNHIPLVANLVAGEIKYKQAGKENFFAVSGGVIEVKEHSDIVVLADSAEFGHEIDLTRAEAAREEAKKLMSKPMDEKSFVDAAGWLERNQARVKVAKKHHTHKQQHSEQ